MKGYIALEDGTIFEGESFGAAGEAVGEVVFNTSMTGYQEILTDPSYSSQIVTMTYPLIGNYGINETDIESSQIQVAGFVVKEACHYPSNFTSKTTLAQYLQDNGIVGVESVDTRALTRHIRTCGALKAVIWAGEEEISPEQLVKKAQKWKGLLGEDLVKTVTCKERYLWEDSESQPKNHQFSIVAMDFGIKFNILRILSKLGCKITVVPAHTTAEEIMALQPDGVFLSNGPGDPAPITYAIDTIRELIGTLPIFGICLGHQLLALALGGSTYKLKFGHRGANHPVRHNATGVVEITSQNHGFCVDIESLKSKDIVTSHINLNDNTSEGLDCPDKKLFSVQYHPESSPGPHDSGYLFEKFLKLMEDEKKSTKERKYTAVSDV